MFRKNGPPIPASTSLQQHWKARTRNTTYVIPPRFDQARDFHEGLAAVKEGHLWGYIDRGGKYFIPPMLIDAGDYSENRARVRLREKIRCYRKPGKSLPGENPNEAED